MGADMSAVPGASHEMVCETETSSQALFVCTDDRCGRRVVVGKSRPGLTVLDQGEFSARHTGGTGGAMMSDVAVA
jgi:hypothetical protein